MARDLGGHPEPCRHSRQGRGLRAGPRAAVEDVAHPGGFRRDELLPDHAQHDLVRDERSVTQVMPHGATEIGASRDVAAEHIAGGDVRDTEVGSDTGTLGSLPGSQVER